jgi:EAL domain-containing protein (putative c-di-GMP-specific phosphodiesterase class I)
MGCRQLQGYLLSPPLEPGQLLALPGLSAADQERSAVRA